MGGLAVCQGSVPSLSHLIASLYHLPFKVSVSTGLFLSRLSLSRQQDCRTLFVPR
jgi:hypothetical protein